MRISIEVLTQGRIVDADRIFRSAFETEESRESSIRHMLSLQPDGYFLTLCDGQPAGMVGAVDYGRFAYVGMMAVEKRYQSLGIGRAQMAHLMDWLAERGVPTIYLDATAPGERLYRRFGFAPHDMAYLYRLASPVKRPCMRSMDRRVRDMTVSDMDALKPFDIPIFGADRSRLFRLVLATETGRAFLSRDDDGAVEGFVFARANRIGPWVARSREAALRLLNAALHLPFSQPPSVFVPGANPHASELLERMGFSLVLTNRHMRRGQTDHPENREEVYGQASFAEG